MNWRSLAAWLELDADADLTKCARYGITLVYVDPRSGNAAAQVAKLREGGFNAGIYAAANWRPELDGAGFAEYVSLFVKALIPQAFPLPSQSAGAPVMLDLEAVSIAWTSACLARWRQLRPIRETAYTNEPFKDPSVVPFADLEAAGLHWYAQTYYGSMTPADAAAVMLEPARWGFPADRLHPFYDGARLPGDHRDGCVFTLSRLPY